MKRTPRLSARVAMLLFGSGLCALVYQIAWLRMLRLVFGASTTSSAAVIGIFMGGLGLGGWLLGKKADSTPNPLALYAKLELGVAAAAAASPLMIALVRSLYLGLGGTQSLGPVAGTILRLLLAAVVIGIPTVLAGGTLPAAVKAAERVEDLGRRQLGFIYAANTLGAVTGTFWATFLSLELLGNSATIWVAALLNATVGLIALQIARGLKPSEAAQPRPDAAADASSGAAEAAAPLDIDPEGTPEGSSGDGSPDAQADDLQKKSAPSAPKATGSGPPEGGRSIAPPPLVYVAALVVGFSFILMELIWYRMLAPVLGGSSYTFGIILAVALLGIGLGGMVYSIGGQASRPSLLTFAITCGLEALFMILPFAWGDDLAVLAMSVRPWGFGGFLHLTALWTGLAALVILPSAIVAGYQFPMLVALLGTGDREIGQQIGVTYAWNTGGSILGSLAGGFGLVPLLGAPGAWRFVVVVLGGLALICLVSGLKGAEREQDKARFGAQLVTATALLAAVMSLAMYSRGPTAFWRHTPIGAGKIHERITGTNQLKQFLGTHRRNIIWEADGLESSVALHAGNGYGFVVHGKPDGNAIGDAPTQIMAGMAPATLHPNPRKALVIGLGTGTTAGWLAAIPSMERVDVIELEEAIVHIAGVCQSVNQGALSNPKVNLVIGDGREFLLTSNEQYDVIMSEPSNPYRAGIASLFTREFYEAAAERLSQDGIMAQWLQAYDIQPLTVVTVLTTMQTVFESVEIWEVHMEGDMLMMARKKPVVHDVERVRKRLREEPFRSALWRGWRMDGAEGFYAGFVADSKFTRRLAERYPDRVNTDDWTLIEFEFARSVGKTTLFNVSDVRAMAAKHGLDRPGGIAGLDWSTVEENRVGRLIGEKGFPPAVESVESPREARLMARHAYANGDLPLAHRLWTAQESPPSSPIDLTMVSEVMVAAGDDQAPEFLKLLKVLSPTEALALESRLHLLKKDNAKAADLLTQALISWRKDPWAFRPLMTRALESAFDLAATSPEAGRKIFEALSEPFAAGSLDADRLFHRLNIGMAVDFKGLCRPAFQAIEPNPYWDERFLAMRARCYAINGDPLSDAAHADLAEFREASPIPIDLGDQTLTSPPSP